MIKAVVVGLYIKMDYLFGSSDGGTAYGNLLRYPELALRKKLDALGVVFYSEQQLPLKEADVVICVDVTPELFRRIKELPPRVFKILQSCESVLYAPFSHYVDVIMSPVWDVVLTWNRAFAGENIFYYDIPIAGKTASGLPETLCIKEHEFKERGVVVASGKGTDPRGFAPERNRFYRDMAAAGCIDLYGQGWKVSPKRHSFGKIDDKIAVLKNYSYALVIENIWTDGYVTEKIGDCILAGLPVIYCGDSFHAQKRFPDTFVPLESIDYDSFVKARGQIKQNYTAFFDAVQKSYGNSDTWCDSYISVMENIFRNMLR